MSPAVQEAALWIASPLREQLRNPIMPQLREKYGLSYTEAVEAIRVAWKLKEGPLDGAS